MCDEKDGGDAHSDGEKRWHCVHTVIDLHTRPENER